MGFKETETQLQEKEKEEKKPYMLLSYCYAKEFAPICAGREIN